MTHLANIRRQMAEAREIRRVLRNVLAIAPTVTLEVDDGGDGEYQPATRVLKTAFDAITAVDEARVRVRDDGKRLGVILFVLGNEPDEVLADWSWNESDPRLDAALNNLI